MTTSLNPVRDGCSCGSFDFLGSIEADYADVPVSMRDTGLGYREVSYDLDDSAPHETRVIWLTCMGAECGLNYWDSEGTGAWELV